MKLTTRIDLAGIAWCAFGFILFIFDSLFGTGQFEASTLIFNFLGISAFLTTAIMNKETKWIWWNSILLFLLFVCLYGVIFS